MEVFMMKGKSKRIFALLLAGALALSLTACGNGTGGSSGGGTDSSGSGTGPESSKTSAGTSGGEPVNLTFCIRGDNPANIDEFYEKLDALTLRDLNLTLDFVSLPAGENSTSAYNLSLTTGEYDMYYSGNWVNHAEYARKHAFYDITDLVKEVTPALYETIPESDWQGSMIDGRLYCIPQTTRDYSTVTGFIYREDLRKKYNVPEITDMEGVGEYLRAVLPNESGMSGLISSPVLKYAYAKNNDLLGIDSQEIGAGLGKYGIVTTISSNETEIKSLFDEPAYLEALQYMKSWYDEGLVNKDILSGQLNDTSMMEAGTLAGSIGKDARDVWGWGYTFEKTHPDWDIAMYEFGAVNYKSRGGQTSTAISASSPHVNECLKLMEKIRTDQEYYDLLFYGVEGSNYELTEAGELDTSNIPAENSFNLWKFWGDEDMVRKSVARWSGYDEFYEGYIIPTAQIDPMNGFQLDLSSVSAEMAACEQVYTQYQNPLQAGISNDVEADLELLKTRYQDAGIGKIIETVKTQLADFAEYRATLG